MNIACPACIAVPDAREMADVTKPNVALSVPGMKCAACIQTVESTLNQMQGVRNARVNLTLKRVTAASNLAPEILAVALRDAGFDAYPFDPERRKSADDKTAKDLILRLGVAGFAMMNVMLLSVAVWSGAGDSTRDLFHLISAAIALPATIFSARPFFRNAWSALKGKRLNMDVPISLAILLAAGMSLYEALNGGAHAYFDAALSLTFFLLVGRVLEHHTRAAARSAAEDLSALEVQTARRRTGPSYEEIRAKDLQVNDIVQVPIGMRAPVDGVSLDNHILTDRSFLTGESDPVSSQQGDIIRAGEINIGAPFHMQATATGEATSLRQMARLVETAENARNKYTTMAERAARIYAPAVHLLALITFIVWFAITSDFRLALNIAIAVLIITCPCALGLAVPAVATAAVGRLFNMGFLVTSGTALERLAEVDMTVFDKTGTLTIPGQDFDLSALNGQELRIAKALADSSKHPVSQALAKHLTDTQPERLDNLVEHPGKGITARVNGQRVALGKGQWLGSDTDGLALQIEDKKIPIRSRENLRAGAHFAVSELAADNMPVQIISGDTVEKTQNLANQLGVGHWQANISPESKHDIIKKYQSSGHKVAMIGDGINDTAALALAHASVAPGSALDAARNAADVILLHPSLDDLPSLFRLSRLAVRLSRQNFAITALYNAVAIPVATAGFANPMLAALAMSASSLTVLLNALRIRIVR